MARSAGTVADRLVRSRGAGPQWLRRKRLSSVPSAESRRGDREWPTDVPILELNATRLLHGSTTPGQRVRKGLPKGPFHGVPFLLKDLYEDYGGYKAAKQWLPRSSRNGRRPRLRDGRSIQGRRPQHFREDGFARIRPLDDHGIRTSRRDAQSLEPGPYFGRLIGRRVQHGGRRRSSDRECVRWRRLDPRACILHGVVRAEADTRPQSHGSRCRRGMVRPGHRTRHFQKRAGQRIAARLHGRSRCRCALLGRAAATTVRGRSRQRRRGNEGRRHPRCLVRRRNPSRLPGRCRCGGGALPRAGP